MYIAPVWHVCAYYYVCELQVNFALLIFQEASEKQIGSPYYVTKRLGRKRQKMLNSDAIIYISIRKTLKVLLQRPDIRAALNHEPTSTPGIFNDVCDGAIYRQHPVLSLPQKKVQLVAYYDEIELCNPLGSHAKIHKIGCLFYSICNIHAKFRSQLKSMFISTLATAPVISRHGINEVMKLFVDELNEKLEVTIGATSETYEVALLAILADNLAAHQIGGFKESMSFAYRICRSCMTTTEKAKTNFKECYFEVRTPEDHKRQCDELERSALRSEVSKGYGINRKSILNSIPNFCCCPKSTSRHHARPARGCCSV